MMNGKEEEHEMHINIHQHHIHSIFYFMMVKIVIKYSGLFAQILSPILLASPSLSSQVLTLDYMILLFSFSPWFHLNIIRGNRFWDPFRIHSDLIFRSESCSIVSQLHDYLLAPGAMSNEEDMTQSQSNFVLPTSSGRTNSRPYRSYSVHPALLEYLKLFWDE